MVQMMNFWKDLYYVTHRNMEKERNGTMKIIKLTVENFLKVVAVTIEPGSRDTVVISGKNGQGKSGVLNAIASALAGSKAQKLIEPIHKGKQRASITVETEELIITRTWTKNGTPGTLRVKDKKERQYASPQAFLDKIIGDLSFDPLAFARSTPKEQREALIKALGIDITSLDMEHNEAYGRRTVMNRMLKHHQAVIDKTGFQFDDVPDKPVDLKPVWDELKAAQMAHREYERIKDQVKAIQKNNDLAQKEIEARKKELITGGKLLRKAELKMEGMQKDLPDLDAIQAKVDEANTQNAKIAQAADFRAAVKARDAAKKESDDLTKALERIEKRKSVMMKNAKIPIKGLSFTNDGITFQGVPFSQISEAEKMRVSIAIAMTLNPDLRVISVNNASLLDDESLAMIESMAKDQGYQVWLEIVKPSEGGTGFVIEEGELVEAPGEGGSDA